MSSSFTKTAGNAIMSRTRVSRRRSFGSWAGSSVKAASGDPENISARNRSSRPISQKCCGRIRTPSPRHRACPRHALRRGTAANLCVITVAVLLVAVSCCDEAPLPVTDARPLCALERHGELDVPTRCACRSTGLTARCCCAEQVLPSMLASKVMRIFTSSVVDVLITAT